MNASMFVYVAALFVSFKHWRYQTRYLAEWWWGL